MLLLTLRYLIEFVINDISTLSSTTADGILSCSWKFKTLSDITMHVVPKKHEENASACLGNIEEYYLASDNSYLIDIIY